MTGSVVLRDPKVRRQVEAHIQQLIDMLDDIDGDADLEPELGVGDDCEGDDEREHDPAEYGIADLGGLMEQLGAYGAAPSRRRARA